MEGETHQCADLQRHFKKRSDRALPGSARSIRRQSSRRKRKGYRVRYVDDPAQYGELGARYRTRKDGNQPGRRSRPYQAHLEPH